MSQKSIIIRIENFIIPSEILEDEVSIRIARPLTLLALFGMTLATVYSVIWLLIMPQFTGRVVLPVAGIIISVLTLLAIRFNYIQVARHILLGGAWLIISVAIVTAGGTRAPLFSLYIMIVILVALLSGWRLASGYTLITIIFGLILAIMDTDGTLFVPFATPLSAWLSQTATMLIVAGTAYFVQRQNEQLLEQAQDALAEREKAETALRESEERFRLISSVTSDYTFSSALNTGKGLDHTLLTGAFKTITGYTPEEFMAIGGWRTCLHPDDVELDDRAFALLQENKVAETEVRIIRKDGTIRWVQVQAHPVINPETGTLMAINGGVRDITQQKQSQDAIIALNADLQNKTTQLIALNEIAQDISAVTDLETTLNRVLEKLQTALPLDVFYVALHDQETQTLAFPIMYDDGQYMDQGIIPLQIARAVGKVLETGEPLCINRTPEELAQRQQASPLVGSKRASASLLMAPLPAGNQIIGTISVQSYTPDSYDEKHVSFLTGAANQIAIAIQNARLYDSLQSELFERKRLEAELQQYSNKLEKLVKERTQSLQRVNEQLELILNTTSNALAFADARGDIVKTNPAFLAMFGDDAKNNIEGIIKSFEENGDVKPVCESLIRVIYNREKHRLEAQIISDQQGERDIDLTLLPVEISEDDKRSGVLLSGHDITHIREVERFKSQFVADAVHDLATPITGLSTRLYLLKRSPEKLADHVASLENQVQHLRNLLEDLRTLSRMDRGNIELNKTACNINDLVRRVFDTYEPVALDKQQLLQLEMSTDLPSTMIDERQIERVLVNLVSNAINYTPEEKTIHVSTYQDNQHIVFRVKDEGMGIEEDDLPHVFDRFYRTDEARDKREGGTGLGLAITKEIVALHGGSISATSEHGQGSTFTMQLPRD